MRRSCLMLLLAVAPAACQEGAPAGPQDPAPTAQHPRVQEVERHGITWRFHTAHHTGHFANGDPWVVGPVQVVEILPQCTEVEGRVVHGSMVDPDPSRTEVGYDSALYRDYQKGYQARLNVARDLDRRPLRLRPGQSLVSVESQLEAGPVPLIRRAAVLTVLAAPPPEGSFRPPYCKGDKTVRFREEQLDYSVLGRLAKVGDAPDPAATALLFEKLWLDHVPGWLSRLVHPTGAMADYGRDLCADVGTGALVLQLDLPDVDKRDLLVRMVQLGIDNFGNLKGGCRWDGNGGHGSGRKLPILLAGAVLHDPAMLRVGRDHVSERTSKDRGTAFFGEDAQTFVVRQTAPGVFNFGIGGYTQAHRDLPEWGFAHANDPSRDDAQWDKDDYRRCCTANAWVGQGLAARIMGLQEAWHHDAFFAYLDRYLQTEAKGSWQRAWKPWHAAMWDAYRSQF